MKKKSITRREFLRFAALSPLAGAAFTGKERTGLSQMPQSSRVVLIRDEKALKGFKRPNAAVIQDMLDEAVSTLLGEPDPVKAWKRLVRPSDIVGIKTNVWTYIPTTREVEQALSRRIRDAGVPEEDIGIDDRGVRQNPIFRKATALVNARPARTHHWAGMGSLIKNYIMFTPQPSAWHGDSCANLARIWFQYGLKEKTKLNVLVMLTPQFHGIGPHSYSDRYVWEYKGLIVSQDPVAADATGLRIIQAKRRQYFGEERALATPPKHIRLAETRHHLGIADPSRIELIKLGWMEEVLV